MIGSNTDSNTKINTLTETAVKLGASGTLVEEALKNTIGSDNDSRKIIGLLKLISTLVTNGSEATVQLDAHNIATDAHGDIRVLIEELTTRLNALANSDDVTLDQMGEIVAYIKNNQDLIDGITTSKVNVSDIIDNLTTSVANKPLSAKQGAVLKTLIDGIKVPTLLSQLAGDANNRLVTDTEKENWNGKVSKDTITLGTHTDGLVYVFIDGAPVGSGITIPTTTT